MKSKKTFIKYIIVFVLVILALYIGKTTSLAENVELRNRDNDTIMNTSPDNLEGFSFQRGNGGDPTTVHGNVGNYPFLCIKEYTGWSFYTRSENIDVTADQVLEYEKTKGPINIETSIAFGLMTANEIGQYNTQTLQHLVWGSSRYAGQNGYVSTVTQGSASWYDSVDTIIQRAKQYGDFYYGVLNGQDKALSLNLKKDKAKVYIDQENKDIIVGPYKLTINNLPNNNFTNSEILDKDHGSGLSSLYNELTGKNIPSNSNAPAFATFEIKDRNQTSCNIILLDKDGKEIKSNFPNWDEDFYFKYKNVPSNISKVNPQISINHIKSISGEAYYYESRESKAQITRNNNIERERMG